MMKKSFINIISVILVSTFLIGCKHNQDISSSSQHAEIIEDKFIVKNSRSDYNIVIPKNAKRKETAAANDLATYLRKSSGARINVLAENEVLAGSNYISLGNTSQFRQQFADYSFSKLDRKISSYFISTKDDNIYIYSDPNERGEGTLYGAWDLLHELVGYEYYAED